MSRERYNMKYRQLPHGSASERFSVLGLGTASIQEAGIEGMEQIFRRAIDEGVNYFDMCAGTTDVFAPFGRAIAGRRDSVFFQLHLGAVYNEKGEYGWSRDVEQIKRTVEWELETMGVSYADMGFLHCVDDDDDYDELVSGGVLEYLWSLYQQGVVRHIGFSSHTPDVAERVLDTGVVDMIMFSINPAYDFERGDEFALGTVSERAQLFRRCQRDGVGISVMKPFHAGKLLDADGSPLGRALTCAQCLQYALDRPGVLTTVPGVRSMADLELLLSAVSAPESERDYSVLGGLTAESVRGDCVYCGHCRPCPAGIDIGLVNKYYDLALAGDKLAVGHYEKLAVNAAACVGCGHCDSRCPFDVAQSARMATIAEYFGK